jgi:hypothetical protein
MPRLPGLHDLIGVNSPSAGPLVIAVVSSRGKADSRPGQSGVAVGVFDAASGRQLAWFRTDVAFADGVVASHVYQSDNGPVLVLAPDRHPVRQWLLPQGQPFGPAIKPGGSSRAIDSYRDRGHTILVVADAHGRLRRFDAATGAPVGRPIRFGTPEPPRGLSFPADPARTLDGPCGWWGCCTFVQYGSCTAIEQLAVDVGP